MSTYGFRLFTVQLRKENRRKPHEFEDCDGEHFADVAERLLKSIEQDTKVGLPKQDSDVSVGEVETGEVEEPTQERALKIESVRISGRVVLCQFYYGRFSDHSKALGMPGKAADIELLDHAPSRLFNFVLAFPDEGSTGIAAMEDISRTCPITPLARWLSWQSQQETVQFNKTVDNTADKKSWWKLILTPMADADQLDRIIERGELEKLELIKFGPAKDRTRDQEYFRVTAPNLDENLARHAGRIMKGWFGKGDEQNGAETSAAPSNSEGARQLAAVLSRPLVELDFDDGWVVLKDEGDRTKKISPTRLSEVFVYPISRDKKPSSLEFYDRVRSQAMSLQDAIRTDVDWVPFI